jgi:twitching motility protein PilT
MVDDVTKVDADDLLAAYLAELDQGGAGEPEGQSEGAGRAQPGGPGVAGDQTGAVGAAQEEDPGAGLDFDDDDELGGAGYDPGDLDDLSDLSDLLEEDGEAEGIDAADALEPETAGVPPPETADVPERAIEEEPEPQAAHTLRTADVAEPRAAPSPKSPVDAPAAATVNPNRFERAQTQASQPSMPKANPSDNSLEDAISIALQHQMVALEARLAESLAGAANPNPSVGGDATKEETLAVLSRDWGLVGADQRASGEEGAAQIDFFLNLMRRRDSKQLHLHVGHSPMIRIDGDLIPLRFRYVLTQDWDRLIEPTCPPGKWSIWLAEGDVEFYYDAKGMGRVRVSLFRQRNGASAIFEMIPATVPTIEELALPPHMARIADLEEGLVLVCGVTGGGATTTTASLIDLINRKSRRHIVTIEQPIDYVFVAQEAVIHQREVRVHTESFESGVRAGLRENADVILISHVNSGDTLRLALEAVETGSLVFAGVNSRSVADSMTRLLEMIPEDERATICDRLGDALRVAFAQQLVITEEGSSVPALEILLNTVAVAKDIRQGDIAAIAGHLSENRGLGMMSMDDCLFGMWTDGIISQDVAYDRAHDRDFMSNLFQAETERLEQVERDEQLAERALAEAEMAASGMQNPALSADLEPPDDPSQR